MHHGLTLSRTRTRTRTRTRVIQASLISLLYLSSFSGCFATTEADGTQASGPVKHIGAATSTESSESSNPAESIDSKNLDTVSKNRSDNHKKLLLLLLTAEIAATRNDPETALRNYIAAAKESNDPGIAMQATQWAVQFQQPIPAIIAAELWAEKDRNDLQAQMVAMTLLIGQSIEKAIPYLTRAIEINPEEVNQHIVGIQARLSQKSAEHLKMALHLIAKARPQDANAQVAAAQTAASLGDIAAATTWVDSALKIMPNLTPALQLKAKLIRHEDNNDTRALEFLADNVKRYSDNAELRFFYSSALLDAERFDEAKNHLKLLTQDKKYGGQALIFLGELYVNEKNLEASKEMFLKALSFPENQDKAQYLLGELSETTGKDTDAINWYTKINPGPYHVPALLRAAYLLKSQKEYSRAIYLLHDGSPSTIEEQKQLILSEADVLAASHQLEDAFNLVDQVLQKVPNDKDILFSHGMIAIKLKHYEIAERDLKAILLLDPRHADTLNALGYLYSQQPEKQKEAKAYILQALQISPDNPAYLDTLAWYYYQTKDYPAALENLKKAQALSQENTEIASHLGEVLWAMGQREEAKTVLLKALERVPNDETLLSTIQRLKIETPNASGVTMVKQ